MQRLLQRPLDKGSGMSLSVSIIIVNWNSGERLRCNLRSLLAENSGLDSEILVVDNASRDGSVEGVADMPGVHLLRLSSNRGFAAGCNEGIARSRAPNVLFLNPDIRHTRDNIATMVRCLEETDGAAGGCGRLVDDSGHDQDSFQLRRLPGRSWALRELFLTTRQRRRTEAGRRFYYLDRDRSQAFPVEQPAAACLLIRKSAVEAVGGFDERFRPAWFEDVDLARRLQCEGLTLWYWPAAVFVHEGGYSAAALGRARFLPAYWRNARRYYRKHFPMFGRVYGILVPLAAGLRWLASPGGSTERRAWAQVIRRSRCEGQVDDE